MSHIFISYSRRDIDFAQKIVDALATNDLDTWIDWKSIPKGEDWEQEIYRGIEEADAFLFLISPDSVASEMCNKEIAHAVQNGKRILPIVLRDTEPNIVHPEVSKRNWIFCRDGQDDSSKAIEEARKTIHTDYEWLKYHTKLQVKALDWKRTKDRSRLLRGKELHEAKAQLVELVSEKDPKTTDLQYEFLKISQKEELRQRRRNKIGLGVFVISFLFASVAGMILFDRTPAAVTAEGHILEVRNRFNYRFFHEDVGSTISVHSNPQELTPHGGSTIVIGTDSDGKRPGSVLAYDMRGHLRWEFDANSDPYYGPAANFSIKKIIVEQIMNNGEYQIIFTSQKTDWFPSELVLLNAEGELLGSYWNSGFIYQVLFQDFNKDRIKEMIVLAVNNNLGAIVVKDEKMHPLIVYILSPGQDFTGQAFPDVIPERPSGTEFNGWIAVLEPYQVLGAELKIVPDDGESLIEVKTLPQAGYIYLDAYGVIRRVGLSDGWRDKFGDKSPADLICFLRSESDHWYFPAQVDQDEICPWYVRE